MSCYSPDQVDPHELLAFVRDQLEKVIARIDALDQRTKDRKELQDAAGALREQSDG